MPQLKIEPEQFVDNYEVTGVPGLEGQKFIPQADGSMLIPLPLVPGQAYSVGLTAYNAAGASPTFDLPVYTEPLQVPAQPVASIIS